MSADSGQTSILPEFDSSAYLLLSARMEDKKMTPPTMNKHALKTQETREQLLRAAEQIFVRDGYENADLGEIAKLAGRTKGAIYAQFKNKEDMFLALVQDYALRRRAVMQKMLAASTSIAANFAAFRKYFLEYGVDDTWNFLLLEFKLYTVRHPDSIERLHELYEGILPSNEDSAYSALLGPVAKGKVSVSRASAVHAAFAMLSALQLESKFNPRRVSKEVMKKVAANIFDSMFGKPPSGK